MSVTDLAKEAGPPLENAEEVNLLDVRAIRSLVMWSGFPYIFQCGILLVFLGLMLLGFWLTPPQNVEAKLYAKSNLVNLAVWGLWWPVMIWMAVLFGRAWCAVCPLELVAGVSERTGRRLGIRQFKLSRAMRAGWLILVLYILLQLLPKSARKGEAGA